MKNNLIQNIILVVAILYAASFLERYLVEYKDHKTIKTYEKEKEKSQNKVLEYEKQISIDSAIIYSAPHDYIDSIRANAFERYRSNRRLY